MKEENTNQTLRPESLKDYVGQKEIKENLDIYIKASILRKRPLDHILLNGLPGYGKTTLATLISKELNTNFQSINASSIEKISDIASILAIIEEGDILFIDEIHALSKTVEEALYNVLEDGYIDILISPNGITKHIKIELPNFTLIGATTKTASISKPLRDRFPINMKLKPYNIEELTDLAVTSAKSLGLIITSEVAKEIAIRSRYTPRVLNNIVKRINDYALVYKQSNITKEFLLNSFKKMNIHSSGLNEDDISYLNVIKNNFNGGPVGIDSISSTLGENIKTIEEVIEPFLIKEGFIKRTKGGRIITEKRYD